MPIHDLLIALEDHIDLEDVVDDQDAEAESFNPDWVGSTEIQKGWKTVLNEEGTGVAHDTNRAYHRCVP